MHANRALVVDDSRVARITLKKTLETCNLVVDCVDSGETAISYLEQAQDQLPGVIFMDNVMPGMDGLTASRRIRETWQHIPIIMCTGTGGDEYIQQARQAGAAGVIPKPTSADAIGQLLARLNDAPDATPVWLTDDANVPQQTARPAPRPAAPGIDAAALAALQQELQALQSRVDQLEANTLALGADNAAVGAQLERLVAQDSARQVQLDALNGVEARMAEQARAEFDSACAALQQRLAEELEAGLLPQARELVSSAMAQLETRLAETLPSAEMIEHTARAAGAEVAESTASRTAAKTAASVARDSAGEVAATLRADTAEQLTSLRAQIEADVRAQVAGAGRGTLILAVIAAATALGAGALALMG